MPYKVDFIYFRPTGKFFAHASMQIDHEKIDDIWEEVHELRRLGRLPGLRVNSGRDLTIFVNVPDHPERRPYLAFPPSIEEEDVTPIRVPTGEMEPLVRLPLEEMSTGRTSTRDIVKPNSDDEITPVDPIVIPIVPDKSRNE